MEGPSARAARVKVAVCNVAFGSWHPRGQARLARSLDELAPDVERVFFDALPPGCPSHDHLVAPYAFKAWACRAAADAGADIIVWCDASYWLVRPLDDVLAWTVEHGCWFHGPDNDLGAWTNDRTLAAFGLTRDEAMGHAMILAGGFALDMRTRRGRDFLDRYQQGAADGLFAGHWSNADRSESPDPRCRGHRHDQSVASLLIREMGLPMTQRFVRFAHDVDESPTFLARGGA